MTDPRALFAVQTAATLIAAGGKYKHMSLEDVVSEVLEEISATEHFFAEDCDCPVCTTPPKSEMN